MLSTIQKEVLAARQRTGRNVGVSVKAGLARVEVVTFDAKGKSVIEPLSGWVTVCEAINAVRGL